MAIMGDLTPYFVRFERLLKSIAGSLCTSSDPVSFSAGTGSVPAGLRHVTVTSSAGPTTLTFPNGNTYILATGESFSTNLAGGTVPAFTISGGTWKWYGNS